MGIKTAAIGDKVEVRSNDEGFCGAWYEASVSRITRNRRGYTVVYDTLFADDEHSRLLHEFVHASNVRPRPPPQNSDGEIYAVHQLVDAFHDDGWWAGVISDVLGGGRYAVCFPRSREEFEFGPSELRRQLVWDRDKWVVSDHHEVGAKPAKFAVGARVEISGDKENYGVVWYSGDVVKEITDNVFMVQYKKLKDDGDFESLKEIVDIQYIRPFPQYNQEAKGFELLSEVDAFYRSGWFGGVVSKILDNSMYVVKLYWKEAEMEFRGSDLRLSFDQARSDQALGQQVEAYTAKGVGRVSRAKKIASLPSISKPRDDDRESIYEAPLSTIMNCKKGERTGDRQFKASQPSKKQKGGKLLDGISTELGPKTPIVVKETQSTVPNSGSTFDELNAAIPHLSFMEKHLGSSSCNNGETEQQSKTPNSNSTSFNHGAAVLPLSIEWEKAKGVRTPRGNEPQLKKKFVVRPPRRQKKADHASTEDAGKHAVEKPTKKRGRSSKQSIIHTLPSVECKELKQAIESEETMEEAVLSTGGITDDVSNIIQQLCLQLYPENSPSVLDANGDTLNSDAMSIQMDKHVVAFDHFMPQSEPVGYLTTVKASNMSSISLDNALQAKSGIGDMIYGTGFEAGNHQVLPPCDNFNEVFNFCNGLNNSQMEAENVSPLEDGQLTEIINAEERSVINPLPEDSSHTKPMLPFTKSSILWESIEAMEVFRVMPQKPHFRQLEKHVMEFREGMAIGLMVTFASLVAEVRKFSIFDPEMAFEKKVEALSSLEANGFDVHRILPLVEGLHKMRNNHTKLQEAKSTLQIQIVEREKEKGDLVELNARLDDEIMKLEQQIARCCEERDSVVMQKKYKESDIDRLQKDVGVLQDAFASVERVFDAFAASLV